MATLKLYLDDFNEVDYELIAIHTSLDDYRLAFLLNRNLKILLNRNKENIVLNLNSQSIHFSRFTFEDEYNLITWELIENKKEVTLETTTTNNNTLFNENTITNHVSFINELKKVDFLLKISHEDQIDLQQIINSIKKINFVTLCYEVELNEIKSKNHLIF